MTRPLRHSVLGVLIALLAVPFFIGCRDIADVRDDMDAYLTAARDAWGFRGAALISHRGKVILSSGYGSADSEFAEPNRPSTRFYIGSITKQFTAAAVMLLVEQDLLSLEDPVKNCLPQYANTHFGEVTVHQLLSHTSGIPDYTEIPEILLRRTSAMSPTELLGTIDDKPLLFDPGMDFAYSNTNYLILGAIVEKVAGQSYEAFLHRHIFNPLDMENSGYGRREVGMPDRALGYTLDSTGSPVAAARVDLSVLHTAGALYSTVLDMHRWDSALSNASVLSPKSIKRMLTPVREGYAYGWVVDTLFDRVRNYHGGFLDGFNTTFERWVDEGLCIIVFSNGDEAPVKKMARSLAAIAFGRPYDMPITREPTQIDTTLWADYTGAYQMAPDYYRVVNRRGDSLVTWATEDEPDALLPMAPDTFFTADDHTVMITFGRDDARKVDSIYRIEEHTLYGGVRLDSAQSEAFLLAEQPIQMDSARLDRYVGLYQLQSLLPRENWPAFTLRVQRRGEKLYARTTGLDEVRVFPLSDTLFIHRTKDYRIQFTLDSTGQAARCLLTLGGSSVHGWRIGNSE
ncbi:serine hydrolase [candidate division GN15 bacterium]|nr:serine hydrolase [candidate division GN15 bacterium]